MSTRASMPAPSMVGTRTSSQISINDYPEHLNPFYEDEQHKRIRFWTIGSKKGAKTTRSNSFSMTGFKEIWTLKSFRLRKKSSTLGINKTSESPPSIRRQVNPYDSEPTSYGTYDSRLRHTVNIGLNNNFQRNCGVRSSLQDMSSVNDDESGFYRNNRYRSTVQAQPRHTLTPSMAHRNGMTAASSQTSLASTNPFDDDYDDTVSVCTMSGTGTTTRRRKKRRAPPPPVAALRKEVPDEIPSENALEIHNLTAAIESFVKITDTDEEKIREATPVKTEEEVVVQYVVTPDRTNVEEVLIIEPEPETTTTATVTADVKDTAAETKIETTTIVVEEKVVNSSNNSAENESNCNVENKYEKKYSEKNLTEINDNLDTQTEVRFKREDTIDKVIESRQSSEERNYEVMETTETGVSAPIEISIVEEKYKEVPAVHIQKPSEPEILIVEQKVVEKKHVHIQSTPKVILYQEEQNEKPHIYKRSVPAQVAVKEVVVEKHVVLPPELVDQRDHQIVQPYTAQPPETPPRWSKIKTLPVTPISTETENILESQSPGLPTTPTKPLRLKFDELRIHEKERTATTKSQPSTPTTPTKIKTENYEFEVRYVPLRNDTKKESRHDQWAAENTRRSNEDLCRGTAGRSISVKDVIESINKSQSLLKPHVPAPKTPPEQSTKNSPPLPAQPPSFIRKQPPSNEVLTITESTDSLTRNLNALTEDENKINQFLNEVCNNPEFSRRPSNENHLTPNSGKQREMNNNMDDSVFEKCQVRNKNTIDWNPIPKPRRSRNLSDEFKISKPNP